MIKTVQRLLHKTTFLCKGIVTNYKELKTLLQQRGYIFESETDTEVIAKLIHHLWVQHPGYSFRELVEQVVQQLVSSAQRLIEHRAIKELDDRAFSLPGRRIRPLLQEQVLPRRVRGHKERIPASGGH